jgi:hypothetical protein
MIKFDLSRSHILIELGTARQILIVDISTAMAPLGIGLTGLQPEDDLNIPA